MRATIISLVLILGGSVFVTSCDRVSRESGLRVTYGKDGLQQLKFNGVVLEDLEQNPADRFHIWHMRATDLHGHLSKNKQCGWGELNNGHTWNPATHTWQYVFTWGTIDLQFAKKGDTLDMNVTEKNNPDSGIVLDGAAIYPFVLHFPELPSGFSNPSYQHLAVKVDDPEPTAQYGSGQVSVLARTNSKPLYRGFEPTGAGNSFTPIISATPMDSLAPSYPRLQRPVPPGATDTFTVSLKFSAPDSDSE